MIIGQIREGAKKLILIGLSKENLTRLQKGEPIRCTEKTHYLEGMELFIWYGETEAAMAEQLKQYIGPETEIHIDPRTQKT